MGDVTPRNLGRVGIKDPQSDTIPPLQPAQPTLYTGHCGGLYVTWPPNDPDDEVSYYKVRYGTDVLSLRLSFWPFRSCSAQLSRSPERTGSKSTSLPWR